MKKVSIIVPVYNSEKHLEDCLNSILEQTYLEKEIILINDGSTDNSKQIMEQYQEKCPDQIKYYEKTNTGIADTRNFGIEKATGEYIIFVDSDDKIEKDILEKLTTYMEQNVDIIKFKCVFVEERGKEIKKIDGPTFDIITGEDAFNELYYQDKLIDSPCIYLMRREYLWDNNFKFKTGTYHEDFGLIPFVIVQAKTFVSTPHYAYIYMQNQSSITRGNEYSKIKKRAYDALSHYDSMLEKIKYISLEEKTIENLKIYYTNAILLKIEELNKEDQKQYIQEIRKRKMTQNIKARNLKQLIKKAILSVSIKMYLKMR